MKEVTREGYEYELTVNFEFLNDNHLVQSSKDRTGLFSGKPEFIINSATGKRLIEWSNDGISIDEIKKEINSSTTDESLKIIYAQYPHLSKELYPIIVARKQTLEGLNNQIISNEQIIQQPNPQENEFSIK